MAICFPSNNTKINGSLSKLTCHINDCSNDWKIHQKKIIDKTIKCIDNCNDTENNKYEYENVCYEACPEGTYPHKNFKCELTPEIDLILPTTEINIKSSNLDEISNIKIESTSFSNNINTDRVDTLKSIQTMNYNSNANINTDVYNNYKSEN